MKTFQELLEELNACGVARDWAAAKTIEEVVVECHRGDWLLWLASKVNVDKRKFTLAKAHCANIVRHLMKDERSLNAVDIAMAYGQGEVEHEALIVAAYAADIAYIDDIDGYPSCVAAKAAYCAAADNSVAKGLAIGPSSKIIFKSAVLDMTIRNASTNNGSPDAAARLELDIYECTCRHTAEETGATYATPSNMFIENPAQTEPIGGGATVEISNNLRGVTPFDFSYTLSRFGIRIERKTKYTIANGDQITYQMRDPIRRSSTQRELGNQDGWNKPGWTRFVVLVGKVAPGLTVGAVGTPGTYQQIINVGLTRKYVFKVENYTEDRTAYAVL